MRQNPYKNVDLIAHYQSMVRAVQSSHINKIDKTISPDVTGTLTPLTRFVFTDGWYQDMFIKGKGECPQIIISAIKKAEEFDDSPKGVNNTTHKTTSN